MKPAISTLFRRKFSELFFSCCGGVAAPRATAWVPQSSTCDGQRAGPRAKNRR